MNILMARASPHQLQGTAIPLSARIVAVVDVVDALLDFLETEQPDWIFNDQAYGLESQPQPACSLRPRP